MEDYLPILRSLADAGVEFAAIGTWALKVYFPEKMKDYVLHDCDVVLAPDLGNVRLAIDLLIENGWETSIWGECVDANVSPSMLSGKYYVRAIAGDLRLDLTYECAISWIKMQSSIVHHLGTPLASISNIMQLRKLKFEAQGGTDALAAFTWAQE
jgi:hypothetical protein